METCKSLSVVIPVYGGQQTLAPLVQRLHPVLSGLSTDYELIFVNDSSPDESWKVIEELAAQHSWIRGIHLMRNYGQHNALLCGIRAAQGEIIVTMDDDLQHVPEEIPKLVEMLDEGYDVVYGAPQRENHGLGRDFASRFTKLILKITMNVDIAREVGAFRAFRTVVRDAFAGYENRYVNIDALLTWGTTRFGAVCVRHDPRKEGASGYTFRKLLTHALNLITGFSVLPLKIASLMGFFFSLFGFGVLVYVVVRYFLLGVIVQGFAFTASIIAIFSGVQLLALGIIGEYLARMHFGIMGSPGYVVRQSTERKEPSD